MTGNVQLYLAEAGWAVTRMAGRLVGFGGGVKVGDSIRQAMGGPFGELSRTWPVAPTMATQPGLSIGSLVTVEAALSRARQTHERLTELVNGQSLPADHRGRLAGGCFWITLDLHAAITLLIERDMPASAFVLSRPIWEALIRGLWLAECADDQALERFLNDQDSLKPWPMIQDLERKEAFDEGVLSAVHAANKDRLHSMTHIGGPLAARCNSADAIEGNFEASEIVECLNNATAIAVLAALGMAKLSDNGTIAAALLQLVRETSR